METPDAGIVGDAGDGRQEGLTRFKPAVFGRFDLEYTSFQVVEDPSLRLYIYMPADDRSARTGRPVHISNVASATKTAGILRDELPLVDLASADVVIVADTNDLESRVPLDEHRANLTRLADAVPAERTVFSDLPPFPGREAYQRVLAQVTDARGIMRAEVFAMLNGEGRRLDIFSWLPPHLNGKGYDYWFRSFRPKIDVIIARLAADSAAR